MRTACEKNGLGTQADQLAKKVLVVILNEAKIPSFPGFEPKSDSLRMTRESGFSAACEARATLKPAWLVRNASPVAVKESAVSPANLDSQRFRDSLALGRA